VSLAHDIQISKKPPQKPPSEEPLNGTAINGATGKRKRDDEKDGLDGAPDAKRLAQGNGESNEPIVLDDPETGAILIDD
jgi:ubiquitin-like 1-activating enzyme E1 B